MADEFVNVEVNGVPVKAPKGEMIIRVTDAHEPAAQHVSEHVRADAVMR